MQVAGYSGPPDSAPGPEATSTDDSSNGTAGAAAAPCVDVPAPGSFSCQQQKDWGKCSDPTYLQNNYCGATCGRCTQQQDGSSASTPPMPPAQEPGAAASSGGCVDTPPPGSFSCQQQKDWGKCSDVFMVQGNYCAATCGQCSSSRPSVQSFSGPSSPPSGGRRMLLGPQR